MRAAVVAPNGPVSARLTPLLSSNDCLFGVSAAIAERRRTRSGAISERRLLVAAIAPSASANSPEAAAAADDHTRRGSGHEGHIRLFTPYLVYFNSLYRHRCRIR